MRRVETRGRNQLVQVLPESFSARVAENALGGWVPIGHPAFGVHHQNGILG